MVFQVTKKMIDSLCGQTARKRGETYIKNEQVVFSRCNLDTFTFEATVNDHFHATIKLDAHGTIQAKCNCPTLASQNQYCQHVAAILLAARNMQSKGLAVAKPGSMVSRQTATTTTVETDSETSARSDVHVIRGQRPELTQALLALLNDNRRVPTSARSVFESRIPLKVQFTCYPLPLPFGKVILGIECKVGIHQLVQVHNIRAFLDHVDCKEPYTLSSRFEYDAEQQYFRREDDIVIQHLIHIYRNEETYTQTSYPASKSAHSLHANRVLPVPPWALKALIQQLQRAPSVVVRHNGAEYEGMHVSDNPIPLHFAFDKAQNGDYQLKVQGLDTLTVMESYGLVLFEGSLLKLHPAQANQVLELQRLFEQSETSQINIPQDKLQPFIEQSLPGLMKLGHVHMVESVSNQVVQAPLKAKLYLDRLKERLVASIEFEYGNIVINALEGNVKNLGNDHILVREGDKERRILELMEQSAFVKTEGGYFMEDEDSEFDFLYYILPQLQALMAVYATSSVKERIHRGTTPPKLEIKANPRTHWLEFRFDVDGIPETEIRKVLQALEEKRRYYRLPNGSFVPLDTQSFHEMIEFLNEMNIHSHDVTGAQLQLPFAQGLRLMDDRKDGETIQFDESLRELLEHLQDSSKLNFPIPDGLTCTLRDYQKYGFQWLKTLAHYHFGGILADDMGLGKTVQSIAYLASELNEIRRQKRPALIVSPASLIYNWKRELERFAPEIRALIADGVKSERKRVLQQTTDVDVIISSYPLLRADVDLYAEHTYHTLILDEAQFIKNYQTQTAQAVKIIHAEQRFALTGTPIENTLTELWSIFHVVFPDLFPSRKVFNDLSKEDIAKMVRPFILRRLKVDVLSELPEKIETLHTSKLMPDQRKLYIAYLAKLRHETVKHLDNNTFQKNRIKILAGLTRLRQLCLHPSLFVEGYRGRSAKFEQLLEIIEDCQSAGKRMLIFSQFTEMLGLIGKELGNRRRSYFYLDGQTPTRTRVELCQRFNEGEGDIFLISLKAGGTGLNLTGADTVILYDLWWNPAVEEQAADRAHRIGQHNVVQVIRLVAEGTVEEKMYELQHRKKGLVDEVIQPGQEALSALTPEEIREILMI